MSAAVQPVQRPRSGPFAAVGRLTSGIAAVGVKELRGRMRGRRAFAILTIYLVLLGVFGWMVQLYLERSWAQQFGGFTYASAEIGRGIFAAMLMLETLLVTLLAPAVTAGAISSEREKQTLGLLAATPISSLAIVVGKLLSALTYVFLLIAASVPLTALVFVFGGVGPDDVLRGYAVLIVTAIGFGAVGLACSAILRRTQAAIIVAYTIVLIVTLGTRGLFLFWLQMSGTSGGIAVPVRDDVGVPIVQTVRPPEALMWLNPFFAQLDVICGAETAYTETCRLVSEATGKSLFGGGLIPTNPVPDVVPGAGTGDGTGIGDALEGAAAALEKAVAEAARARAAGLGPANDVGMVEQVQPFGTLRDALWPQFAVAWLVISAALTLVAVQFVSPTRRWRLRLPGRGRSASRSPS
jgi:ABC-type transport system involved in multi-copper enzyme maturation permease subunit